ncbi:MAG: GAF domain-containing protein, partial [Candidatus Bipolaricaulota bacterium]
MEGEKREARRMQAAFQELLTSGVGYGAYALDDRHRVMYASPSVLEMLNRPEEEVVGRPVEEFVHPQDREKVHRVLEDKLAGEEYPAYMLRLLGTEGRSVAVEVLSRRVAGSSEAGEPMVVGLLREVEGELRAGGLLEILFGIAQDMLSEAEPKAILQRVADAITEHCGFQRAVVALYDLSWPDPLAAPVAEVITSGLSVEEREHLLSGGGLTPEQRRTFFSQEFAFGAGARYVPADRNPLGEELGIRGRVSMEGWDPMDMLFVPLHGRSRIIGHISLDDPLEPAAFTPEALQPVVHLAAMASLLVERARERDEVGLHRRHLTLVHRLAPLLLQAREPADVIQQAVRLLKEHLAYPSAGGGLVREGRLVGQELAGPLTGDPGVLWEMGRTLSPHLVPELPPSLDTGHVVRSGLAVPVVLEGELVGVLEVGSDRPYSITSLDEDTVMAVAGICAAAMRALMVQARLVRLHDLSYALAQAR